MELRDLARKYGTDKVDYHSYINFYQELLKTLKVKSLLEIGVYKGASLRMWRDYLPEAEIFGIDIDKKARIDEPHIKTWLCDYRDLAWLEHLTLGWHFDLIIDDGFHEPEDQINTANTLMPCLNPGGVYVIEDVRAGNKEQVQAGLRYPSEIIEFDIDRLPDDRLCVVRR